MDGAACSATYRTFVDLAMPDIQDSSSFQRVLAAAGRDPEADDRPVICIQGLGHVGSAMAAVVANAVGSDGAPVYNVIGVDLDSPVSRDRIDAINAGRLPVICTDEEFATALQTAHFRGNLVASSDPAVYGLASVIVVDVPFDVEDIHGQPRLGWDNFRAAILAIGEHASPGALVVVETTVPPGTCEKVVAKDLAEALRNRGLPEDSLLLAHSYERVMPGPAYYASISRFWRVYAGCSEEAANACEQFLTNIIDVDAFPLTRLQSTTASETAKVLENSYRAVNIAFAEEWGRFAEQVGIDLFEIIDAIRVRPTHNNIRQPGFGVGGYCLTKDPLMAKLAAKELFHAETLEFPFSTQAVRINHVMPLVTLNYVERALGGLQDKRILLFGISYRSDVGDTRFTPAETFVREASRRGAEIHCHDPLVTTWPEVQVTLSNTLPSPEGFDAIVFAVNHGEYAEIDLARWLNDVTPLVFDANNVLTAIQREAAKRAGCQVLSIGRGVEPP